MNDSKNVAKPVNTPNDGVETEPMTSPGVSSKADDGIQEAQASETTAGATTNSAAPSETTPNDLNSIDIAALAEAAAGLDNRAQAHDAFDGLADTVEEDTEPSVEDQIAELRDRLLRAMAELDNTRKRAERDRQEANKYAVTGFARSVLSVADNLRRAIESVSDDEQENETIKSLLAGIEMTERELLKVFEQQGIKSIDPLGEKFDHNFHQAMFEVDTSGQPPGTIVQVMEPGYVIADRLLRPAMVGIAKAKSGGDTPADPPNDAQRIDTKA